MRRITLAATGALAALLLTSTAPAQAAEPPGRSAPGVFTVSATEGWHGPGVWVSAGDTVSVRVVDGSWTVDERLDLPWVDGSGYDWDTDRSSFHPACKKWDKRPYGALLSKVGNRYWSPGNGWTREVSWSGWLTFQINDKTSCMADNAGELVVRYKVTRGRHGSRG